MQIWKWPLQAEDRQSLEMPEGAKLLTVQMLRDVPHLWALVDEMAPIRIRHFATYPTDRPMPTTDSYSYLGTYQLHNGALVFHLFELT